MQTFLPYPDMRKSLESLDNVRLNKQVVETFQCINANIQGSRWSNHPVAKMWSNNIPALKAYLNISLDVCSERGITHTKITKQSGANTRNLPNWWGNDMFHLSHQSNLVRKLSSLYSPIFNIHPDMPYFWPVQIKCKKTGKFDPKSGLWVKLNTEAQNEWFKKYSIS